MKTQIRKKKKKKKSWTNFRPVSLTAELFSDCFVDFFYFRGKKIGPTFCSSREKQAFAITKGKVFNGLKEENVKENCC